MSQFPFQPGVPIQTGPWCSAEPAPPENCQPEHAAAPQHVSPSVNDAPPAPEPAGAPQPGGESPAASPPEAATEPTQAPATGEQSPAAPQPPPSPVQAGKVARVTAEQVFITLEDGREGSVPLIEFLGQPLPKVGDAVSVMIEGQDPHSGLLSLSKRQADELTFWQAVQPGDLLEGVVTGMNKGGLDIDIGGARAFLPASQVDIHRLRDISMLIGEHVRCVVTQVDRTTHDLIVSRRKVLERERRQRRREALGALVEGELRTGTVGNLAEFGAFVDLGGIEGLLHITDMSWGRVKSPADIVQPGQEIQVRVLKVDRHAGKVSLGLKQVQPDPWEGAEAKYPKGSRVKARVDRLADFGAFLELEPGIDALLPVSEMSWSRRPATPGEVVHVGEELQVEVLKVDVAKRRISVGLKQTVENPWVSVPVRFPLDSVVRGKVSRLMDYGAFIELAPGVEGLIHISEISDKRIGAVRDVLQEGQEVEVRVIRLDPQAQRISLSMRPRREPAAPELGKPKKPAKKRPLRGGLASHFEW